MDNVCHILYLENIWCIQLLIDYFNPCTVQPLTKCLNETENCRVYLTYNPIVCSSLPPDKVESIDGSWVEDVGADLQKRQGAPSSGKSSCETCSICFNSGVMPGLSAELLLVGGWRPGGGSKELGGIMISGIKRVSGGSNVSCVVVLNRAPPLILLLPLRRPPIIVVVEVIEPWAVRKAP